MRVKLDVLKPHGTLKASVKFDKINDHRIDLPQVYLSSDGNVLTVPTLSPVIVKFS